MKKCLVLLTAIALCSRQPIKCSEAPEDHPDNQHIASSSAVDQEYLRELFFTVCNTSDDRMAVRKLLEAGYKKEDLPQALSNAILSDRIAITDELLQHGANPNETTNDELPLMAAVRTGNPAITKVLLAHGACPKASISAGEKTIVKDTRWLLNYCQQTTALCSLENYRLRLAEIIALLKKNQN